MIISVKQVPKIELPAGQVFHRVQRTVARKGSVKINRMILPPAGICRIPDDCIDKNRYPLFMARSVLRELIESLPSTRSL